MLGLDFIGASVLEVVSDETLKDRVVATMNLLGMTHIPAFDVLEAALRKNKTSAPCTEPAKRIWKRQHTNSAKK